MCQHTIELGMFPSFRGVRYLDVTGIGREPGVYRRDNSNVIKVGDYYYVYYNRGAVWREFLTEWRGSVWAARSTDGHNWEELGEMIPTGPKGSWDEWAAYCPNILADPNGSFYLYYTGQPRDQAARTPIYIGVGVSDSPEGPFKKHAPDPIFSPSLPTGAGDADGTPGTVKDGRFDALGQPGPEVTDRFDGHRVDDASVIPRGGRYLMYYKGRGWKASVCETKIGMAEAHNPTGPWTRVGDRPVIDVGHEIMVWPHGPGVAVYGHYCTGGGPGGYDRGHRGTVFYADDGSTFEPAFHLDGELPRNPGGYIPDCYDDPVNGLGGTWGISFVPAGGAEYLVRWEMDLRSEPRHV